MNLMFLLILFFLFKPIVNIISRKGYELLPESMKAKPYKPNLNQMTTGNKKENTELNQLKKRDKGATFYEYEMIELLENKDEYVKSILREGKTHLAKEAQKKKREIDMIKISPRENQITIEAKMKIKEQLIGEYKDLLKSAVQDANSCYSAEVDNAKRLVKQYQPLSSTEQERLEDLERAEKKRQEEIRKYNRAIYQSKWQKF